MKKWKIGVSLLSFFLILCIPHIVHGVSVDNIIDETEHLTAPFGYRVSESVRQMLSGEMDFSFSAVLSWIVELFFKEMRENLALVIKITAAGLLSGVLANLPEGEQKIGSFACALLLSFMALQSFSYAQAQATETMDGLFLFVQGLLPAVSTAAVTSGSTAGAGTVSTVFVAMQVFMQLLQRFMMPLISVITVLAVCDGLGEERYLGGIVSCFKQLFKWSTGLLLVLYGAVIGLRAGSSAVFDRLAGKTVKYAIGSFVPVVGGALADSLETVTASAKAIRGALGVGGMIGVGFVAAAPVLTLGALALSYKIAGAVISVCGEKKTVELIAEIGSGIVRMLAVVVSAAVMFVISLAMLCFMGGAV